MMDLEQTTPAKVRWRSLVRKSEFQKIYEQGVKMVGRLVVVYLLEPDRGPSHSSAPDHPTPRPSDPTRDLARAVVASRKVGNAVARNRAKRLLREAFRTGLMGSPGQAELIRDRFLGEPRGMTAPGAGSPINPDRHPDSRPDTAGEAADPDANNFAGLWVLLVARHRILGANSREVREELDGLLSGTVK